jgi:hypothetical protein
VDRLDEDIRALLEVARRRPRRRSELQRLGVLDNDLRRLVRRGHLQLVRKHYLDGATDPELARIICAQAAYPGSAISHFTAARLADLRTWTDRRRRGAPFVDAVWLTRPPTANRNQRREDVVLRRAGLSMGDLTRRHGFLVTSLARTVVDLARELPLAEALVTIDHALRIDVTKTELQAVLDRQYRWPGAAKARTAIALGDPRAESALESIARAAFAAAGLPPPVLQASFWDGSRWMPERVDLWWPEFRTVGEADGLAKFDADTFEERRRLWRRSHQRDQRLSDLNVELIHFGWEDVVGDATALVDRFRSAFQRGKRRTGDEPLWRAPDPTGPDLWLPSHTWPDASTA